MRDLLFRLADVRFGTSRAVSIDVRAVARYPPHLLMHSGEMRRLESGADGCRRDGERSRSDCAQQKTTPLGLTQVENATATAVYAGSAGLVSSENPIR